MDRSAQPPSHLSNSRFRRNADTPPTECGHLPEPSRTPARAIADTITTKSPNCPHNFELLSAFLRNAVRITSNCCPLCVGLRTHPASGTETTFFCLGATALVVAVENAGAKHYREAARLDVEQKTTPDHTLAANQTADLLLVFVPPNRKIPPSTPLEVAVELEVDGVLWATRLNAPAR